jgi:membrane-bound serine protease (ClpP class)
MLIFLIGSVLLFPWNGWQPGVNPILILLLSAIALGMAWLVATKSVEAMSAKPVFDLERLVGMTGQASSDIRGEGTVYVNGEEWSARSKDFIPAGGAVRVVRREGLTLEVEPAPK